MPNTEELADLLSKLDLSKNGDWIKLLNVYLSYIHISLNSTIIIEYDL